MVWGELRPCLNLSNEVIPDCKWDLDVGGGSDERLASLMSKVEAVISAMTSAEGEEARARAVPQQLYRVTSCWQVLGLDNQFIIVTGTGLVRFRGLPTSLTFFDVLKGAWIYG